MEGLICALKKEKVESAGPRTYHRQHIRRDWEECFSVKRYRRQLQELACLGLVMSLAHGLLLCVGCDGHAALHSGLHTHDHTGAVVPLDQPSAAERADGHSHCSRCADIPMPMVVAGSQVGSLVDPLASLNDAGYDVTSVRAELWASGRGHAVGSTSYFTPLSSIILVV